MASRSRTPGVTRRSILALCLLTLALAAAVAAATACSPDQVTAASPSVTGPADATRAARGAPAVKARSGIVVDRRSGKVLWSKDAGLRLAPASCTKIMTALLVLEHYRDLDRMVRAPASVTEYQTVAIGLRPGDRISVLQALRATMTKSANDACVTLATAVAGNETRFVTLMNRRARQLGLTHTHFVNSRGSPKPGHYSCARDLARLGRYAMRDAEFRDLVGTKTRVITWPPSHSVTVTSHNRLLDYAWGDGIKTGATKQSKMVLAGSGRPGELKVPLIVVTMREPTRDQEERDAVALFLWAAGLYEQRQIVVAGEQVAQVAVTGGAPVAVVAGADLSGVVRKAATVSRALQLPAEPLAERPPDGTVLGTATYRCDGLVVGRVDLVAATIAGSAGL
jgi:D-alanyl-D-alanine carboxypeptidase (penicillin-binding protein 5/6)